MVSSRPEVEWDDTERAWMLGLAAYEATLCPMCGLPSEQCQSPEAERLSYAGVPNRCHVATARMQRAEDYKESPHPGALVYPTGLRAIPPARPAAP